MQIELSDLFLSNDVWGLLGPFAILVIGFFLISNKKYRPLAVLWLVVEMIMIAQYFTLVAATPFYYWNIFILIMGVVSSIFQFISN